MKKIVILAAALLSAAFIISGFEIFVINSSVNRYTSMLDDISESIKSESYDDALDISNEIIDKWHSSVEKLDTLLYHDYVDTITCDLEILPVYVNTRDLVAVDTTIRKIKTQLNSLKESELPTIYNIL